VKATDRWRLIPKGAWRGVVELYNSDDLTHAASIAYYALLSLFPLFLLALAIIGSITNDPGERDDIVRFIFRYFPRQFDFITGQLASLQASPLTFSFGGLVALTWASLGVFNAITSAVNHAWAVEQRRRFLKHRLVGFLMLLSAGGILLLALVMLSAVRLAQTQQFFAAMMSNPWLIRISSAGAYYAATVLLIVCVALVFYFLPNTTVRFRDVWPGALLVGLLWRGALAFFAWYAGDLKRLSVVHGSIAAVVLFLLWIYVSSVILLYGVEVTASYARMQDAATKHPQLVTHAEAGPPPS
jgi:membrane protein